MPLLVVGYRISISESIDTIPKNQEKLIDTISMYDTSKLSFNVCVKNTGMRGGTGRDTFDPIYQNLYVSIHRKFRYATYATLVVSDTGSTLGNTSPGTRFTVVLLQKNEDRHTEHGGYRPYSRKSASQPVLSRTQLTLHATRRTHHGASRY